jgi:NAD(P)-dependent dehydrogenase (short-subunit alcohol dehydrogenase family)
MAVAGELFAITGAASGIGRATATVLAQRGALLSLADICGSALEELRNELEKYYDGAAASDSIPSPTSQDGASTSPRAVLTTVCDVTSRAACDAWIAATNAHFGTRPLAGAVNLAGIIGRSVTQERGQIRNLLDAEFDQVMDVNCRGIWNSLRAELPAMRLGGSSIVNAASIAGLVGVEANAPYVASKHAVIGLTRTLAKEEGKNGIRCNAIAP